MKTTSMNIPVDQLTISPDLKAPDNELIQFISKVYGWSFFNENAEFPVKNGIAFLDSLCSVRFDKLCRADKRKIQELMELVLKKINDLMPEASNQ